MPFFLAQVHVKGLDTPLDPCAAILVLIVTALLCLGIKEVLALSLQLVLDSTIFSAMQLHEPLWCGFYNLGFSFVC